MPDVKTMNQDDERSQFLRVEEGSHSSKVEENNQSSEDKEKIKFQEPKKHSHDSTDNEMDDDEDDDVGRKVGRTTRNDKNRKQNSGEKRITKKWSNEEEKLLRNFFRKNYANAVIPKKEETEKFLRETGMKRVWENVRDKVRNEIRKKKTKSVE